MASKKNRQTYTPRAEPRQDKSPGARLKRFPLFRTRRRTILTLVIGVPLLLCLGTWLFGFVAFADAARLAEMKGIVQTRHEDEPQWEPARLNQLLWHDHRVRTGTGSSARLLFFDVSSVDLEEETEVSIAQVSRRRRETSAKSASTRWKASGSAAAAVRNRGQPKVMMGCMKRVV